MKILRNVRPTSEQLVILQDAQPGFRLIRGAAGSGKTTTALMRLKQLCRAYLRRRDRMQLSGPVRVLVLTFNRTLSGYISQLVSEQTGDFTEIDLTVSTFAKWAVNQCGENRDVDGWENLIRATLREAGFGSDSDYFFDEVQYVLGRFLPQERKNYLEIERTGRGRAPRVDAVVRRRLLQEVVLSYEEEKTRLGWADWNDIALDAAAIPCLGYDIVVVDEAQDVSANQMRAVLAHLGENHSTTFIMDAAQRIYPQSFLWRELGIDMRPNLVSQLKRNYRNTAAIARLATSLLHGLTAEEDGVVPNPDSCEQEGELPEVIEGLFSAQIEYMLDRVDRYLSEGDTVAVLHPFGRRWFDFVRSALRERGFRFCEITRKSEWPTGQEQIALSTFHSAKGLEFDHVLMPGLNREVTPHGKEEGDGTLESLRRLVAMGIGRARKSVTLGYKSSDASTLIGMLDPQCYQLVKLGE